MNNKSTKECKCSVKKGQCKTCKSFMPTQLDYDRVKLLIGKTGGKEPRCWAINQLEWEKLQMFDVIAEELIKTKDYQEGLLYTKREMAKENKKLYKDCCTMYVSFKEIEDNCQADDEGYSVIAEKALSKVSDYFYSKLDPLSKDE